MPVDDELRGRLAAVLPGGRSFGIYHLSTPPSKADALCSAPPNERADRTFCESHFLAVAIDAPAAHVPPGDGVSSVVPSGERAGESVASGEQVLVLGIEVLLYTTAYSTTLFVAKADSTGYLNLLGLPLGTSSPIREVCSAFIAHLVDKRRRKDVQFVVSLFARAQAQYLFPGSVDYRGKHVLDDRGLVKWWCRVLNPLLESPPAGDGVPWRSVTGHLVVPGLDTRETRAFIPRESTASWALTHPLEHISHYRREFDWVPPRCLIPRFPDDPKSRFRDELDEEADTSRAMKSTGSWRSVKTLDMFWEMMAYRQECSSGRMTGFIWVVFDDDKHVDKGTVLPTPEASFTAGESAPETPRKQAATVQVTPSSTPRKLFPPSSHTSKPADKDDKAARKQHKSKTRKRGPVQSRRPRVKTEQRNYLLDRPTSTAYYHWPVPGRGERIVSETDYKRTVELLLHLDFANLDKALTSTRRWMSEAGMGSRWGYVVTGTRELPVSTGKTDSRNGAPHVNNLSGLVKRKPANGESKEGGQAVNVLGAGLVRKRPREPENRPTAEDPNPEAKVLDVGLVRKKPKI